MLFYIIDDEEAPAFLLEQDLKVLYPESLIKKFKNQDLFLEECLKIKPDVMFLDIEMPERNGIELAKKVNQLIQNNNIVFVTGYKEYAYDAMNVYASGYVTKPSNKDELKRVLEHLRYPINQTKFFAKTFGNFDLFINDVIVKFRLPKSKMLLAYLIDREGALVTRKEAASILYESGEYTRSVQRDLCRTAQWLQEDLQKALGSSYNQDLFIVDSGYRIDPSKIKCDLYEYLKDNKSYRFMGEYMEQYSFGEIRKLVLSDIN